MAQIQDLQVQCEKDMMRVRIIFDRPFYGMVFSKGHYSNVNCVHVPSGLGQTQATFDISLQVNTSKLLKLGQGAVAAFFNAHNFSRKNVLCKKIKYKNL